MKLTGMKMELTPVQLASRYELLRSDSTYRDVTLTAHDNIISAHKCVLSVSSQFFQLLFQQADRKQELSQRSSFELVGLSVDDASLLDAVVDFMYSGVIYINDVNLMGILKLADYLAIDELLYLGEKYLEQNLTKENCLKLYLDMKKSLILERHKVDNSASRRINDLLSVVWEMVEKNYDYIIDHHEFMEIIPEEVEKLVQRNFNMEKVLGLAVKWMNTWPLGFMFAESLINISHSKLDTAANLDHTEECKVVVDCIKQLRCQVLSRTLPASNSNSMLKKLEEIRRLFDKTCVESENDSNGDKEKDQMIDTVEMDANMTNEKDTEAVNGRKSNEEVIQDVGENTVIDGGDDKTDIQSDKAVHSDQIADKELEGFVEPVEEKVENVTENMAGQEEKVIEQPSVEDRANSPNSGSESVTELSKESTEDKLENPSADVGMEDTLDLRDNSVAEEERQFCEKRDSSEADYTSGVAKVDENCIDTDTVGIMENEKIDGTEQEMIESESTMAEATLHDRVRECIDLLIKTEQAEKVEVAIAGLTPISSEKVRRGRGQRKKQSLTQAEVNVKRRSTGSQSRTRGKKRKRTESLTGMIEPLLNKNEQVMNEETCKTNEDEESKREKTLNVEEMDDDENDDRNDGADGDYDDDIADDDHNVSGDVDNVPENVFDNILKQPLGSEIVDSANRKKLRKTKPRKPGYHECVLCHKVYSQKYRLNQHMNQHLGIKPYKCVVCLQNFTRSDHAVRHMKSQHVETSVFKCDVCGKEFEIANEVVSHSITHTQQDDVEEMMITSLTEREREYLTVSSQETGKTQYKCKRCSQSYKNLSQAKGHVYFHTGEKPYKCGQCDSMFTWRENLTTHVRSVHDGVRGDHRCSKCRKCFIRKENYDAHIEKCEPIYKCEQCPKTFYRKTLLDNHSPIHDAEPKHKCPHCQNKYRYRKHMLRHIRKDHLNEEEKSSPCICDQCGIVVKNKEALYRHKKMHKLPDKECDVCGKAFKDNATLKDHKLMHTNIRDYQCEICSMLFARKGNLVRHQKRHRGERKYRCDICGMCFVANCDLTRHKNTHLGVKKFPCRFCGRKFGLRSKVVVHERIHTGERPYFCREENCGKTFKQTGDRVRHEKKVHNITFNKYMTLYELATGETEDIYKGVEPPKKAIPVPEPAGEEVTLNNLNTDLSSATDTSTAVVGYSQNPVYENSYMEEAEMSKIFQRTVAVIKQEAISNSGTFN